MNLSFHAGISTSLALLVVLVAACSIWLTYYYFLPEKRFRIFLFLDTLAAILITMMLLELEFSIKIPSRQPGRWAVLIDTSKSMGLGPGNSTRLDQVKRFLHQQRIIRHLQPVWFTFGETWKQIVVEDIPGLQPTENSTRLGEAIREVSRRLGQNAAGIIVISDGQETEIFPWENLASHLFCPVYCVAVEGEPPGDTAVADVVTNSPVYAGEKVQLHVSLRQSHFDGRSLQVTFSLAGKVLDQKTVQATQPLCSTEFVLPALGPGEYPCEISLAGQPEEKVLSNNRYQFLVRVISARLRVLYVETALRWEYKFLKRYLESLTHLQPVFLIRVSENVFQQTGGENLQIPPDIFTEDFLQQFDILILGDFDFGTLTRTQMEALNRYVLKAGKSLILLGGEHFLRGCQGSILEAVLPVIPGNQEGRMTTGEFLPVLTEEGKAFHLWEESGALPALDRINEIRSVRPGASILLVKNNDPSTALMVLSAPGQGKCLLFGTDATWRWYFGPSQQKKAYEFFWGRLLATVCPPEDYLGLGRSLPELISGRRIYAVKEKVEVTPVFTEKKEHKINFSLRTPDNRVLPLSPVDDKLSFVPDKPGAYFLVAEAEGKSNIKEIIVTEEGTELFDPSINETLLKKIAEISRGAFFHLNEARKLQDFLLERRHFVTRNFGFGIPHRKYWVALVYFILNLCWWKRRRENMV